MFDLFSSNINTSCIPNSFQPKYPSLCQDSKIQSANPNKPYEVKGPNGDLKGYFWYQGNSVNLIFDVSGEITSESEETYSDISYVIKALDISATIYNLRHEIVAYFSNGLDAEYPLIVGEAKINNDTGEVCVPVTISISQEISNLKFPRGTYFLDLMVSHPSGYCETLFSVDTCTFEVR